ncbi:hypothetical protein HDU93_008802, partial [Gonapodya sp. JEL0774]
MQIWHRDRSAPSSPNDDDGSPEDVGLQMKRLHAVNLDDEEDDVHRTDSGVGDVKVHGKETAEILEQRTVPLRGRKRYRTDPLIPEVKTDLSTVTFAVDLAADDRPVVLKKPNERHFCDAEISLLRLLREKGVQGCVELLDVFDEDDTVVMVLPFLKKLKSKG